MVQDAFPVPSGPAVPQNSFVIASTHSGPISTGQVSAHPPGAMTAVNSVASVALMKEAMAS